MRTLSLWQVGFTHTCESETHLLVKKWFYVPDAWNFFLFFPIFDEQWQTILCHNPDQFFFVFFVFWETIQIDLGFVWIELILLKLKTYCWNHCSKIIFKYINSTVGPIFNEKVTEKWNLWVYEQCTDILFTEKSQHLRLLFMHCSLNSSRTPPKTRENKKKKKNEKNKTQHLINANAP